MNIDNGLTRRRFLRYVTVSGVAVPLYASTFVPRDAQGSAFQMPADMGNMTELEKLHVPKVTLPPVVEDGSQAPIDIHPVAVTAGNDASHDESVFGIKSVIGHPSGGRAGRRHLK